MARTPTRFSPKTSRPRRPSSTRPTEPSSSSTTGEEHLFADSSLPAYETAAAALLTERVVAFLNAIDVDNTPMKDGPEQVAPGALLATEQRE